VDERITIDGGKNSPGSGSKAGDSEEVRGSSMEARKSNLDALNGSRAGFCDGLYRRGKKGRERGERQRTAETPPIKKSTVGRVRWV
jgi:hypothetical protein